MWSGIQYAFASQRNLLGAQTDIPMQGMKILVGSSPKQSSILWFTWRGRKRRPQQTQAACECLFPEQISSSMLPSSLRCTQSPSEPGNLLLCGDSWREQWRVSLP